MSKNGVYFNYWGKAKPQMEHEAQWHPVVYHSLDVAAVGREYLIQNPRLLNFFCEKLNCSAEPFINWSTFFISLHDLGKFSEAFQSQKPQLFELLHGRQPNPEKPYTERHDTLGQWVWNDYLSEIVQEEEWIQGIDKNCLDWWMRATTGHHGQPPKVSPGNSPSEDYFSKKDRRAVESFARLMADMFLEPTSKNICNGLEAVQFEKASQELSWWFAGITVLADWLGSNTEFFQYNNIDIQSNTYWEKARENAKKALECSGVVPAKIKRHVTFNELFPDIEKPSPLQKWAMEVSLEGGPQIHLLEDVTGAGKTEAAILLAYRLMAVGSADGFFVGLPTVATANAMYDRIANVYRQLFSCEANLVLANGSRQLVEGFAKTVFPAGQEENDREQRDDTASARCTAWLADHIKRALLAQAGVGTIDQVLLSILYSKHQSLRLLGTFGKVLIVDEVHACDAYMLKVLEVVLEFHGRAGGSVILLSATLAEFMKNKLLQAFTKGLVAECPELRKQNFPLVTSWSAMSPESLVETPLATRELVKREVKVNYFTEKEEIVKRVLEALGDDKCVCWIRNTIFDALEAKSLFSDSVSEESLTLFHARYCLGDRLNIEEKVLEFFGKGSDHHKRKGRLVIATQVVEQSLDVDFDIVISDLAPIDRVIQRAGRLHRHNRNVLGNRLPDVYMPDERQAPCIWIFAPAWSPEPKENWLKNALPKTGFVYPDHARLWLTAKSLQKGSFSMPEHARKLIELVFSEEATIPKGLQAMSDKVFGDDNANISHAQNNTLNLHGGYKRGDVIDWWSEVKTPSRLGEESMNIVLARWEGDRLVPWIERKHAWAYSTLRVATRLIARVEPLPGGFAQREYERVKGALPDKGLWSLLLALKKDEHGRWLTKAWTKESDNNKSHSAKLLTWVYDSLSGLQQLADSTLVEDME